jgi:hypothetical protein
LIHLGLNLTDPYTRESLGQQEREVGRIEIVSLTDKTSTARLISGVPPANFKPGTLIIRPSSEEFDGKDPESGANSHSNSNSLIGASPTKTPLTGGTKRLSDDW